MSPSVSSNVAYRSELATVLIGDALEALPKMANESADLVVVDPPYGAEWQSRRREQSFEQLAGDGAGDREAVREVLEHAVRVVRRHRHLYVFGPVDVLDGLKVSRAAELIWDKGAAGMGNLEGQWGPAHESISFAVSKHIHGGQVGYESVAARLRRGSVLRFPRPTGRHVRHPSEKPVALLRELVESSSRQGEVVLDPCAGIGGTGVAAVLAGRRTVLIEVNETYGEEAVRRVRKAERLYEEARRL